MYKIIYHRFVLEKDVKNIAKYDANRIARAIHNKLTVAPDKFGKYLHGKLKGYLRLRVDNYRVVYEIKNSEVIVFILKIGQRKDEIVYEEAIKRLGSIYF